jgi:hypothetical protein
MPNGEKALMRSLLFGRDTDPLNLAGEESKWPLLRTQISRSFNNFALTDFQVGTLIFLQRLAQIGGRNDRRKKRRAQCFAENCKNCLATAYLIWQFRTESADTAAKGDLAQLRADLAQTLKGIPRQYRNVFCKNLFANHSGLNGQ